MSVDGGAAASETRAPVADAAAQQVPDVSLRDEEDEEESFRSSLATANASMLFGLLLSSVWGALIAVYRLYVVVFYKSSKVRWSTQARNEMLIPGVALVFCYVLARVAYHYLVTKPDQRDREARLSRTKKNK
jgi:hypothetical protein